MAGVASGAAVAWVLVRRRTSDVVAGPVRALPAEPPRPPGLEWPLELKLDTLLRVLVDQAAAVVEMACGVALREQDGGPIRIRAVSRAATSASWGWRWTSSRSSVAS